MTLIDDARSAFDFTESRDVGFVRSDTVAVWLESVRRLGQGIAQRCIQARTSPIADVSLETIVVGFTKIHNYVDLSHAAVHRQDRPSQIRGSHRSHLSRSGPIEYRRSIQVNRSIQVIPMLMNVV